MVDLRYLAGQRNLLIIDCDCKYFKSFQTQSIQESRANT